MSEESHLRRVGISVYISLEEAAKLNKDFSSSMCQSMSEYFRKKLLDKPITTRHRNQSLDDFVTEMILLRNELAVIRGDFVSGAIRSPSHMASTGFKEWETLVERSRDELFSKIDEIKDRINKLSVAWLLE
jgi:hypothetical protein